MSEMTFFNLQYLFLPALGGIGVALLAGPLGSLMVWRRLAYFGDTLAHSGLLGITLALALHFNIFIGVALISLVVALALFGLQSRLKVSSDTLLGLISYTALASGLLILGVMEEIRVDVLGFLYGDILTLGWSEVALIYGGGIFLLGGLIGIWPSLLRITIDPDLAQVEGVRVRSTELAYLILLAIVIAIAVKVVGVLLITALLIIPATAARHWAKSPEQMASLASGLGAIATVLGILASHIWDVPTGPAIVVAASGMLLISIMI